jgi:hypothetical protein
MSADASSGRLACYMGNAMLHLIGAEACTIMAITGIAPWGTVTRLVVAEHARM